jgi:hypothetical protein
MHRFLLPLALVVPLPATAQDCRAVVERAMEAHGGFERLSRWQAVSSHSRGTLHAGGAVEFTAESSTQLPAQMRTVLRFRANGRDTVQTQVLNGDRAWSDVNGQARELDPPAVRELKEAVYAERVAGLVVLRQPGFTLSPLPERSVAGRPAVGVKVAAAGHRDVGLYFDKESGLLVRSDFAVLDSASGQEMPQEKIFASFQEFGGVLRPTRVIVYREGKVYLEVEVVEIKPVDRLPDCLFSLP